MKKTKIIVSLAVTLAIAVTGYAFAKDETIREKGKRPSFKMTHQMDKKPEMTEEQKAEMEAKKAEKLEEAKAKLSEKLDSGEITSEQYDKMLEKLSSGDFGRRGKGHHGMKKPKKDGFEKPFEDSERKMPMRGKKVK